MAAVTSIRLFDEIKSALDRVDAWRAACCPIHRGDGRQLLAGFWHPLAHGWKKKRVAMDNAPHMTPGLAQRERPTWFGALWFQVRASLLRLRRAGKDILAGPARHRRGHALADAPVLGEAWSLLWAMADDDRLMTAGKVQNLRVAAGRLNGVVVPAGMTLGFWSQVGRATKAKGFVAGRELREGCLVPSIGGGLCQLSNALYQAALSAGLDIVERHPHSRIVPGSQAAQGRDATVFWNYVDLRLRGAGQWRLEVALDAETLRVTIRGHASGNRKIPAVQSPRTVTGAVANACNTCDGVGCWRHETAQPGFPRRTWIQQAGEWPEFAAYRDMHRAPDDRVLISHEPRRTWPWRLWRRWRQHGQPLPQIRIDASAREAAGLARRLHCTDRTVVIPQALLVPWWRAGLLAGRRFEVLMTALPAAALQAVLDRAGLMHPTSHTLADFRADAVWLADESAALACADAWITPHHGILKRAGKLGVALPWAAPSLQPDAVAPAKADAGRMLHVLLPASSLARKGVHTLRAALQGIQAKLLLPPGAQETEDFWAGCVVQRVASIDAGIGLADVVVLPAWVEHQPRGLLLAMARGIPVIATQACGLATDDERWHEVGVGDVQALRQALHACATVDLQARAALTTA